MVTSDTNSTCWQTASTTPTSTPPTTPKFEPACIDSWSPAPKSRISTPIAPAKPVRIRSNLSTPTANAPTSTQRKLAHPVSDSALLLTILAHISPPACIYVVCGAGCSFLLNLALTEIQPELGTFHAWYLLYIFFRNPDAIHHDNVTQRRKTGAMQSPIRAWRGGMIGEWLSMLFQEFQRGFLRCFLEGFEIELQRRGIRIEVQYEGYDEDEFVTDNYDKIAGSLRDLSKEMAEALQEMKELLAKVRLELRRL